MTVILLTFSLLLATLSNVYGRKRVQYMLREQGYSFPLLPERVWGWLLSVPSALLSISFMVRLVSWWTLALVPLAYMLTFILSGVNELLFGHAPRVGFWVIAFVVLMFASVLPVIA